uniref:EVE domain-containing protein n=1 Tax=Leersia perrieri TaxID=77586 RepID=A0A0D9VXC8_9ORYZ
MPKKATPAVQPAAAGKYWLLKTEPGEWSWSDQAGAPGGGVAPWDGVRNRQAINSLRAMRRGDRCLFYHSGAGAASRRVVGVVEVAREWYEAEGEGGGGAVDVRAAGEFRRPVALGDIKKAAGEAEVEGMREFALLRQPRLSVMPVPAKVWDWICEMGGGCCYVEGISPGGRWKIFVVYFGLQERAIGKNTSEVL